MRYISFEIKNFRGIQRLFLNLGKTPSSKIFILVGINESGKTTLLEALYRFYYQLKIGDIVLDEPGIEDIHTLIPKSNIANFNDTIELKATIQLDEADNNNITNQIKKELGFNCSRFPNDLSIRHVYTYQNSEHKSTQTFWHLDIYGKTRRGKIEREISYDMEIYRGAIEIIKRYIPSIIYYENFLFDFPERIYLESYENEGLEQEFYRRLLQDILDTIGGDLSLTEHIINRARDERRSVQDSLESVINKMEDIITDVVFRKGWSVFSTDPQNKSITLSYPIKQDKENRLFIELKVKDGTDSYFIVERSLGFRWFFTFLLLTQFRVNRENVPLNTLFLLDEPAYNLHQTAQKKLLRSLDELTTIYQTYVMYSTHSQHLINPVWLESTFIVQNSALDPELYEQYTSQMTDITADLYRTFVAKHPTQTTYYQPILDKLEYTPSDLEFIPDVVMVEGKNDFYALTYFQNIILKRKETINLLPGNGAGSLDSVIQLYYAWGKNYIILLDSDKMGNIQKTRYNKKFGAIVKDRIYTLKDINSSWDKTITEKLFDKREIIRFQRSVYPESTNFNKTHFYRAIQEKLINKQEYHFYKLTEDRFKKLLTGLANNLKEAEKLM